MILPGRPLLYALGALAPGAAAASLWPALQPTWWALAGALALAAGVDALRLWRLPVPAVRRHPPARLLHGQPARVRLTLRNRARRALRVQVFDHPPTSLAFEHLPRHLRLPAGMRLALHYPVTPTERGAFRFTTLQLRLDSPWRLWQADHRLPLPHTVHVFPDLTSVSHYQLLAVEHRLGQLGIRRHRRRGSGSEFHQLRAYQRGDPLRQIEWKASARLRRLISREYQEERDQRLLLLLDCGQRMATRDDLRSHLDLTLQAALLLAHVALRQGDSVGLASFGNGSRWLAPAGGSGQFPRLLTACYDLQPGDQAPDYASAAAELLQRERRRALVVLLTNLRDEDSDDLQDGLRLLRHRHRLLVASLRETALDRAIATPPRDLDSALRTCATHDYLHHRQRALARLRASGIPVIDCTPTQLSVQLINHYQALKAGGAF